MRAGVDQGGIINPVLFSLYVNDMRTLYRYINLALYVDNTAITAISHQPALLINYLETYANDIGRWLEEWRIACVLKCTMMLFAKARRGIPKLRPVQLIGQQIHWVDTARYVGVTLDTRLTWSNRIDQVREKRHRLGVLGPFLNRRNDLSIRNGFLLYKQLIRTMMGYACPIWRFAAGTHVRKLPFLNTVGNFFIIIPTRCTNFTNLFWHETLHVSDSSSVHHQEFINCTLTNGICHTEISQMVKNY